MRERFGDLTDLGGRDLALLKSQAVACGMRDENDPLRALPLEDRLWIPAVNLALTVPPSPQVEPFIPG